MPFPEVPTSLIEVSTPQLRGFSGGEDDSLFDESPAGKHPYFARYKHIALRV